MGQAASRYASALYDLAQEENKIDLWQAEVRELIVIFQEEKSFLPFLKNEMITSTEKKEALSKIFSGRLDKTLLNFLYLVVEKGRSYLLLDMLRLFNTYCNESKGIEEGYVYSSDKLDEEDQKRIEDAVSQKLNKKIQLHNKVDHNLISGVKVVVNDFVMDGSLRNRMNRMKETLIKEGR